MTDRAWKARRLARVGAASALTVLAALVCTPTVGASSQMTQGETRLKISRGVVKQLRHSGVTIKPLAPSELAGRTVTLPLTAGVFDLGSGAGSLTQGGGLKLFSAGKAVSLRRLRFDVLNRSLSATVGGKPIRLARVDGAALGKGGFDSSLQGKRLPLTTAATVALNRALDLSKPLRAGRSLGSLEESSTVQIDFGRISLGGPDTIFSKLESLGTQMGAWGASEKWGAPGETYFGFQIAPTTVTRDASAGVLQGAPNDGVSLEIHAPPPRNMLLQSPRIDLAAKELTATIGPMSTEGAVTTTAPIATLDYSAATFQIRSDVGMFELMGIKAIANQFIADQLNERLGTAGLIQAGETLARVTVTLHAR